MNDQDINFCKSGKNTFKGMYKGRAYCDLETNGKICTYQGDVFNIEVHRGGKELIERHYKCLKDQNIEDKLN